MSKVTLYTPQADGFVRVRIGHDPKHGLKWAMLNIAARIGTNGFLEVRVEDTDNKTAYDPIANLESGPDLIAARALRDAIASAIDTYESKEWAAKRQEEIRPKNSRQKRASR